MTEDHLRLLKANVDKVVRIVFYDGEAIVAKIHAVSDEDQDVIYDVVSTTRPSEHATRGEQPAYLSKLADIAHIEPLHNV